MRALLSSLASVNLCWRLIILFSKPKQQIWLSLFTGLNQQAKGLNFLKDGANLQWINNFFLFGLYLKKFIFLFIFTFIEFFLFSNTSGLYLQLFKLFLCQGPSNHTLHYNNPLQRSTVFYPKHRSSLNK